MDFTLVASLTALGLSLVSLGLHLRRRETDTSPRPAERRSEVEGLRGVPITLSDEPMGLV